VIQDSLRDLSGRILLGDGQPRHGGIAPEPRELAFRKVAGVPLQAPDGFFPSIPALEIAGHLPVAERFH